MYRITFKKKAQKELEKLPNQILQRIVSSIDSLVENPFPSGVKKLKVSDENTYRTRVGDYRIIYVVDEKVKIINIRKIGHRKDVYQK